MFIYGSQKCIFMVFQKFLLIYGSQLRAKCTKCVGLSCCHASVELKANLQDAIGDKNSSRQLILHCVNAKIAPTSIKEVNKTRLSLRVHVGLTSCYYKLHGVNWP